MALEYIPFYYSYRKKLEKLSDQEVGRLVRSLLEYGETGETEELAGRESIAFDFIADDINRAIIAILASIEGVSVERYKDALNLVKLMRDATEILTDEAFGALFLSAQSGKSFGSAQENTEGKGE